MTLFKGFDRVFEELGYVDLLYKQIERGPHAILITDLRGTILYVNPKYCQITGYESEELIGENPRILKSGHQPDSFYKNMYEKLLDDNMFEGRFKNKHKDGSLYWIYNYIISLEDEKGERKGYINIAEDITNFVNLETQGFNHETLISSIVSNIPKTGILLFSLDSNAVSISEGEIVHEFFASSKPQIEEVDEFFQQLNISINNELDVIKDLGKRFRKKSTSKGRTFDIIFSPIQVEKNRLFQYCAVIIRDVSDYQLIIEKVQRNEQQLHAIFQNAGIGIGILNTVGKYVRINQAWANLTGYTEAELLKMNVSSLLHPHDLEIHRPALKQIQEGIQTNHRVVLRFVRKDGFVMWCDVSLSVIMSVDRKPESIIAVASDITETRRAREALEKSEKAMRDLNVTKDKFFSIVAHDLKNPFSSIMGLSELALDEDFELTSDQVSSYMKSINQAAGQAYTLLENLLEWARMQTGNINASPVHNDLLSIVTDALELVQSMAGEKEIQLTNYVSPDHVGYFDPIMIQTVVRNLITNAIKYSKEGGKVIINTHLDKDEVVLSVVDQGIGMSQAKIDSLFNLQTMVSQPGTKNEKGTGIGLMIIDDFVRLNNGRVEVSSVEGQGSEFRVFLPLKDNS